MKEQDKIDCIMLVLMMMFLYALALKIDNESLMFCDAVLMMITFFAFVGKIRK